MQFAFIAYIKQAYVYIYVLLSEKYFSQKSQVEHNY